jgi:hypothetical protein
MTTQPFYVTARLNARVQPMQRGEFFEDPLAETLSDRGIGEVEGGGSQLAEEPVGIEFCDVEIRLPAFSTEAVGAIVARLNELGAPKGSKLLFSDAARAPMDFGVTEGLAVYLNGTDLPMAVYQNSDINHVIQECVRLMDGRGDWRGYWEGARETSLYFYGESYDGMMAAIAPFVAAYPLFQMARFERIA